MKKLLPILLALAALALLPACSKASSSDQAEEGFLSATAAKAKQAAARAANATKDVAAKTGRAVGEHAGNFFSGVGEGIERAIVAYDIDLSDPSLAPIGASVNIVRHISEYNSETHKDDDFLLLYFLNKSPAAGTLRLVLCAADAREIGRSELPIDLPADSATYLRFPLSRDLPTDLVRSIALSFIPADDTSSTKTAAQ
jgi:hypothetical protein